MEQPSKLSTSIIAAAVVALVGSVLFFLGDAAGLVGILLMPPPSSPQNLHQDLQGYAKAMSIGTAMLMICVSFFGFATGIGLLRLKNWARISAIVWSSFCVFFGVTGIFFALLMPFGQMPNQATAPAGVLSWMRPLLLILYGVPLAVGVWWLILFTRKNIKAKFAAETASSSLTAELRPRCPVAITVIAWFFIGSAANVVPVPFVPFRIPLILFGYIIPGVSGTFFLILSGLLLLVAGIGLLKLQRWCYPFTIALQLLFLTNGVLTVLSPNFDGILATIVSQTNNAFHLMTSSSYSYFLRGTVCLGLLSSAVILALLIYYRERFLLAVEAKPVQQSSRSL